eukprot:SAG31_NODE_8789_length_1387_cov_1.356366_1_plen_179_part_00
MESAKLLILEEQLDDTSHNPDDVDLQLFANAWQAAADGIAFLPGLGSHGSTASIAKAEKIASLRNEFEVLRARMAESVAKASKVLAKAELLTKGLEKHGNALLGEIRELYYSMDTASASLGAFEAVQARESSALPFRIASLESEVAKQVAREAELQARYRELLAEHATISAQAAATPA